MSHITDYSQFPLSRLRKLLKAEQAKLDSPAHQDRIEEIAARCSLVRRQIRNKKLAIQRSRRAG